MNIIFEFLEFTIETVDDFEDKRLPTLDFKLWVSPDNLVLYTFFVKPTSSNQMIQKDTALPENTKILNSEVVWRMQNTCELLPMAEREVVLDEMSQRWPTPSTH